MIIPVMFYPLVLVDGWLWWRNNMETLSALLAICEDHDDSLYKGPVMPKLNIFFGVILTKLLNKQSRCRWTD